MQRTKRWWHDNINLIVAQSLIQASRDFFRSHLAIAPLAPLPKPTKLQRLYMQVKELEREQKVAADFERHFQLTQRCNAERAEEYRQKMKKYGVPEDTSFDDFREHMEIRGRERADRTAALTAETAALNDLRDSANGDDGKEIALLQDYCIEHPESEMGSRFLVAALRKAGKLDEAIQVARHRIEVASRETSLKSGASQGNAMREGVSILMLKQGVAGMLLEKGDIQAGIEQLERTIAEEDQEREDTLRDIMLSFAYLRLGDAYRERGTIAEARAAWKEALRLRERGNVVTVINGNFPIFYPGNYNNGSEILARLKETAGQI